eukprot:COSAG02_NODE_4300_length_5532_cov_6.802503_2_plen_413_part_00
MEAGAGSDLGMLTEDLKSPTSKLRPIRKVGEVGRTNSVDDEKYTRSKKREKRKVRKSLSLDLGFAPELSALAHAQSDASCLEEVPAGSADSNGSSTNDLGLLKEELKPTKAQKVRPIHGAVKMRRTKFVDGENKTRSKKREKRKVRKTRSLDCETEPEPEPEPALDLVLDSPGSPSTMPCMQSDTSRIVASSSEITCDSSPRSVRSEHSQHEDDSMRSIDETRLQADLEREIANSKNQERLTRWEYERDKEARKDRERAAHGPNVPESDHERLEFLSGSWKGRGAGTKAWWWKPMPTAGAEHISLAIRKKATLADRLRLTYEENKMHSDEDRKPLDHCLSAAARKAAAREAVELERYDTIQYLTELKAASVTREEGHKKDVRARRLGKLRHLAAQGGRLPDLDINGSTSTSC